MLNVRSLGFHGPIGGNHGLGTDVTDQMEKEQTQGCAGTSRLA